MGHRFLNLIAVVCLALGLAVGAFWRRSASVFEVFFIASAPGALWEFESGNLIGLTRVSHWPGPRGRWHAEYYCHDGSGMTPNAMPCFINQGWGGAWHRTNHFISFEIARGVERSAVLPSGEIWLGPPYPNDGGPISTWKLSAPMPYWTFGLPHWMAFCVLILPLASLSMNRAFRWVRRRRRIGQVQCPECGYDLRATSDRCPECGAIKIQEKFGQKL